MAPPSNVASPEPLRVDLLPVTPLNVPRRMTLSTATVVPQLLPSDPPALGHSRAVSSNWETRRINSAPISAVGHEARPKIRPLPRIPVLVPGPSSPGPKSAPPTMARRQISHTSLRPLPSVPEAAPASSGLSVSVSVTPASPLSPPTPVAPWPPQSEHAHLLPPPGSVPPVPRFASLSLRLQTSPDALEPRAPSPLQVPLLAPPSPSVASLSPPPTPTIVNPPSPNTTQRRRISKLRRHLGESVELELVTEKGSTRESEVYAQTVVAVRKLLDLDSQSDGESTDEDDDQYSFVLRTSTDVNYTFPVKRYSRKWIREKGGQRWVEENYSDILRDLRAL